MCEDALALGAGLLGPDRMWNLGAKHLDFAAVGFAQQGGDLFGKIGSVVHHRQQDAVDLELRVQLPLDLVDGGQQLFQSLGGQILRLDGDYDPVGGGQRVDREHSQGGLAVDEDMGILSLHRVQILPQMVSRLMAFTRDTSMPESWMSAGMRSTPSGWCRMPSPGRSGSSMRMRPIASERVKGSLSGCGLPRLMVRLAWGSASTSSTFFPACASPMPKLAQVVVLPTPPFWLATAMICGFNDFTSFLIGCCHVPA